MLFQPVRFQLLKTLGVPKRAVDAYALGKFHRGDVVEKWFVRQLRKMGVLVTRENGKFVKTSPRIEYRGAIGVADSFIDTDKMLAKKGIMPCEVKSVTNAKLKRIAQTEVDWHYQMQACFYALAKGNSHYAVAIVSAEDLRPVIYIFETSRLKGEVDLVIDKYDRALEAWKTNKTIPALEVNEKAKWAINPQYAPFDEFWLTASDEEMVKKIEEVTTK